MKIICELLDFDLLIPSPYIAGWLIGIKELSLHASKTYNLQEVRKIIEQARANNQFVAINATKLFTSNELNEIIPLLEELRLLKIDYFFYTDVGFYQIAKRFNFSLIYQASTYLTNTFDINLALSENESVVISPVLSFDELKTITEQADKLVIIEAFGSHSIFTSRRKLLSTYFTYRKIDDLKPSDGLFTIVEEIRTEHYPIEEDYNGTHIYLSSYYYLLEELKVFSNIKAILIKTKFLNLKQAKEVLNAYLLYLETGINHLSNLNLLLSKGILYRPSVLLKEQIT